MLFFALVRTLVHTVALRALVSNKNPFFLLRGPVFQGPENRPHCDHGDRPERPEFLPRVKKLNSWRREGSHVPPDWVRRG